MRFSPSSRLSFPKSRFPSEMGTARRGGLSPYDINMTKKHTIILQPSGRRGQTDEGISVRSAARELGVEIESICAENATCGKCMVLIEEGRFEKYDIDSKRDNLSSVTFEEAAYFARRPKL